MKKDYNIAYLNYIVSALFYLAAVIGFISDSEMATMWLCLGSVWICIGSSKLVKAGKKQREEEEKNSPDTEYDTETDEDADE